MVGLLSFVGALVTLGLLSLTEPRGVSCGDFYLSDVFATERTESLFNLSVDDSFLSGFLRCLLAGSTGGGFDVVESLLRLSF